MHDCLRFCIPVLLVLLLSPVTAPADGGYSVVERRPELPAVRTHEGARRSSSIHPDLIQKAIARYVERELAGKVSTVQISLVDPREPVAVPPGSVELTVSPAGLGEGLGRRAVAVHVMVNGRHWTTFDATVDVSASADVIVPIRVIKTDELIEAEDVTIARVRLTDLRQVFVTDQNDVIGKSAARPLQAQAPIRPAFLKKPFAVRKGDRVTIEVSRGGLSIQAVGITKSSGELGQSITVANADSGKELRAKIVAPGLVHVDY